MRNLTYLLLTIVIVALLFVPFIESLVIYSKGQIFYSTPLKDPHFSVRWIHSVEKEEWEEFFYVKDDVIYIEKTRFKTFGAGVPSHAGEDSYIKDGWVYMVDIHRKIGDELMVRSGESTNHRVLIGKDEVQLSQNQAAYRITIESWSIIDWMMKQIS